nr:hypothetical protein [Tanacetum cinerariifolium]
ARGVGCLGGYGGSGGDGKSGGCGGVVGSGGSGRLEVSAALVVLLAAAVGGGACKMVASGMVTRVRLPWWCMSTVGGGSYRSGYGETFLGFAGKLFRRWQSAGDGGGWPAAAAGGEGEKIIVCVFCVYNK